MNKRQKAPRLTKAEQAALARVKLPPLPKKIVVPPSVLYYKHACQNCQKEFESSVASMKIIICSSCWQGHPKKTAHVVNSYFKGIQCKKNLPR